METSYRCWYPLQIQIRDLDPLAHVNNTVYFIYFEEARSFYFDQLKFSWLESGSAEQQQSEVQEPANPRIRAGSLGYRYGMLVKEATCTYQLPLVRTDQAEVGVRVVKVGRTSFVLEQEIRARQERERIFATGRTVMVWCDYQTGRPHPVPQSLRAAFEQMEGRSFSDSMQ